MRFKDIAVQTDNCKYAATFSNIVTDILIACIIETTLREDNGHSTAGFQKVEIAFNEQNISANFFLPFAFIVLRKFIMRKDCLLLNIACERRICHNEVEIKFAKVVTSLGLELF